VLRKFLNSPFALLLGTGIGLGLNFPFGKLALAAGITASLWSAFISLGAGLALLLLAYMREPKTAANGLARFAVVSGFLSYVMPNLLTFTVIPKIGSGLTGLMFALSPVVTALLALILKVRPPNRLGIIGIAVGLAGALIVVWGKGGNAQSGGLVWLGLALLIPCFLGAGNIYRSLGWPKGAGPILLGSLTNLAAVPFLLVVALALGGNFDFSPFVKVPWLPLAQLITSTLMFTMFFRLQQIGGPTYLSQIGYVAAAVGLFAGVGLLGEVYPAAVWVGACIIAAGVGISTYSTRSEQKD
jgi:drug/metabolite transporter (DMT)-like permease